MENLETTPLHRSLTRPVLLAGAERELVILNLTVIGSLLFGVGFHWATASVSLFLATVGHWVLVRLAKEETRMREMYVRHASYYPMYDFLTAEEVRAASVRSSL